MRGPGYPARAFPWLRVLLLAVAAGAVGAVVVFIAQQWGPL